MVWKPDQGDEFERQGMARIDRPINVDALQKIKQQMEEREEILLQYDDEFLGKKRVRKELERVQESLCDINEMLDDIEGWAA